jgi:EAL domain-containing protein (putative c-di-GMP-specific phosphodiesterase class I)
VLDEALRQLRRGRTAARSSTSRQLSASKLPRTTCPSWSRLLAEHRVSADRLVLEITESAVIPTRPGARGPRSAGRPRLDIAIDDFGTGWSSMSRLLELPLSALKVDRSFVADLPTGPGGGRLGDHGARARPGLFVVCEGIETASSSSTHVALGCDVAQGYLLSPPLRPEDVPAVASRDVGTWLAAARVPVQGG